MPMLVNKTYLVDTDNIDEAYDLTKITNDKVETFAVGRIAPYNPNAPQSPQPTGMAGPSPGTFIPVPPARMQPQLPKTNK